MRHLPTSFIILGMLISAIPQQISAETNWPGYRGPRENSRIDEAKLPIIWSETENVVWKTPIEGKAWSSPVIWGDRIYLTNSNPEGSFYAVICIDKNSGKVIYDKKLYSTPLPQYCHPFNSYASCSPVIEEGNLYVSFGSPYNACLNPETGDVKWERTDFICNHFRGPGSSPFIDKDKLILQFDGSDFQFVTALNKQTGETIWRTERSVNFDDIVAATGKPEREGDWRKAYSTALAIEVEGKPQLISLGSKALYAYEPENGKELWRVELGKSHSGACRPVYENGLIYMPIGAGKELWAIRPGTDKAEVVWKHTRGVPRRPSVLVLDDLLYMVDDDGVASCVDAIKGEGIWQKRLGSNYSASPIYADGRIYFLDEVGTGHVVKAGREFESLAENKLGDGCMGSPAVSDNALYIRSKSHLYRVETAQAK